MDDFDEAIRIKHGSEWPTDREFEAYFIIINTLRKTMPVNDISYKRNDEYISLIFKNNPAKCICKLYLNEPHYGKFPSRSGAVFYYADCLYSISGNVPSDFKISYINNLPFCVQYVCTFVCCVPSEAGTVLVFVQVYPHSAYF